MAFKQGLPETYWTGKVARLTTSALAHLVGAPQCSMTEGLETIVLPFVWRSRFGSRSAASGNATFVERAPQFIRLLGADVISPVDARTEMGLPPHP